MIVGDGFMANSFNMFADNRKILIYASGVPSIVGYTEEGSRREASLLKNTISNNPFSKLIYFSTCSVYDTNNINFYTSHKIEMENIIQNMSSDYLIVRLPVIVGLGNNKNNLCPYLFNCIQNELCFNLCENAYRNLIDIEDVVNIVGHILEHGVGGSGVINVSSLHKIRVKTIVNIIETLLGKKAMYKSYYKKSYYDIDIGLMKSIIPESVVYLHNYPKFILKKYYSSKETHNL